MEEENPRGRELELDLSEADIAELVHGIDRRYIIDLVKGDKYLKQRVFHGFRPHHLPWERVPAMLARDASGDGHKVQTLVKLWQESNLDLLEEVADLSIDNLQEGIVDLLGRHGVENRSKILWALRLDGRAEIQEALKQELGQVLFSETFSLISQALAEGLRNTQKQLTKAEIELEKQRRLVQRKAEQVDKWRNASEAATAAQQHLQARIAELEAQHQTDQDNLSDLQRQLEVERVAAQELRRSVADLKATLRRQAEEQDSSQVLLELEDERKTSAGLRLKMEKLEQQRNEAFAKRDQALEQIETFRQELEQAQHDKSVIVNQKRQLQNQLEKLQSELEKLRLRREEQAYQPILDAIPVADLESAWLDARTTVREHLRGILAGLDVENETQGPVNKLASWQKWATKELTLMEDVLAALDAYSETMTLPDLTKLQEAQKLLVLRWYLLEYTRLVIEHIERQSIFPL